MKKVFLLLLLACVTINLFAVKISIAYESIEEQLLMLNTKIVEFEAQNPDIEIEVFEIPSYPGSTYKFYGTFVVTKANKPTILSLDFSWVEEFSPFLVDLEKDSEYFEIEKFIPATIEMVKVGENIKAIPYFMDAGVLYYRKDLLEKYNYNVPKTWEELIKIAKDISQKENIDGFIWQGARYEELATFFFEILYSYGVDVFKENNFVLNEPENKRKAIEALTLMKSFIDSGITRKGVTTYWEEDCRLSFQNGEALFMRNSLYAWPLLNSDDSPLKGLVGIAPLPISKYINDQFLVLDGKVLSINPNATPEEIAAAKKFINFLTSEDSQIQLFSDLNFLPVRLDIYENSQISGNNIDLKDFKHLTENLKLKPKSAIYSEISFVIQNNVYDCITGRLTPEKAIDNIVSEINFLIR